MELIAELITQQLFPIAMCLILCYYINTTTKEYTNAIENNTKAIVELTTLVGLYHGMEEDNNDGSTKQRTP